MSDVFDIGAIDLYQWDESSGTRPILWKLVDCTVK